MPLVFVHGVNVRLGPKYDKEMQLRNQYFVNIFYKLLGRQFKPENVISPYWGDLATNTTAGNPYLPTRKHDKAVSKLSTVNPREHDGRHEGSDRVHEGSESMHDGSERGHEGSAHVHDGSERGHEGSAHVHDGSERGHQGSDGVDDGSELPHDDETAAVSLLDMARTQSMSSVIDLVIATASESLDDSIEQASALSELAFSALDLSRRFRNQDEQNEWLADVSSDAQLLSKLESELKHDTTSDAKRRSLSLGHMKAAGTWLQARYEKTSALTKDRLHLRATQVKDRIDKLKTTAKNSVEQARDVRRRTTTHVAAAAVTNPVRKLFHNRLFLFLGDSFLYFGQRGTPENPGPIVKKISDALDQGWAQRTAEDPDLIVVAHSMGGNIICDVASHFRPDQQIDLLITVAAQFSLFADLHMFPGIDSRHRPIAKPPNVKRWINIYDMNDIFGFTAQPMFEEIEDLEFASGRLGIATHADCFKFVSLYEQMAKAVQR